MGDRKRAYDDDEGQRFPKRDRRNEKVIKVLCPYYSAGAIIGKGGEAIKEIKNETGANIQVSKNDVRFPNTEERVISISGDLESMQKVVAFVQEKIRTDKVPPHVTNINTSQNDARKATCKLVVPNASVGKIIGKGGANINKLKEQFNVKIETMKKDEAIDGLHERVVSVESDNVDNVDACIAEMVKDVYEDERAQMDFNVDYQAFGSSSGGGRGGYGGGRGGYGGSRDSGDSYGSRGGGGDYGPPSKSYPPSGGYGERTSGGYGGDRHGYSSSGYESKETSHGGGGYGAASGRSGSSDPYSAPPRADSYSRSTYSDSRSGGRY